MSDERKVTVWVAVDAAGRWAIGTTRNDAIDAYDRAYPNGGMVTVDSWALLRPVFDSRHAIDPTDVREQG